MRIFFLIVLLDLLSGALLPGGSGAPSFPIPTQDSAGPASISSPFAVDAQFTPWITDGDGAIHAVVLQPDGKAILAGEFSYLINGRPVSGLARLNADGTLDTGFLNGLLGSNSGVRTAALQADGKLIVGGFFTMMNGVQRNMLARLNADGSLDTSFLNGVAGFSDAPFAIAVQPDGKVIVGGQFTTVNGVQRSRIVRLNSNGSVDPGFMDGVSGPNGTVRSIVLHASGQILLGGSFTNVSGTTRGGLARLNSDGSMDTSFLSGFNVGGSTINSISIQADGRIIIGGDFVTVIGQSFRRIARLTAGGALDTFSSLGLDNTVNAVAVQPDGKIIVGGTFALAGTLPFRRIVRLLSDGTPDIAYLAGGSGPNKSVLALVSLPDGRTIAAGSFTDFSSSPRALVTRLSTQGTPDSAVNPQLSGMIGVVRDSLVEPDGKILIAGSFTKVNGVQRRRIARLAQDGSLDASFLDGYSGLEGPDPVLAQALARQSDGRILVGGTFIGANGQTRKGIARLNQNGAVDDTFFCNLDGPTTVPPVKAIIVQTDGKILVGGGFASVDGVPRNSLARLNSNGSVDASFLNAVSGANGEVLALSLQPNGKLLVGGLFTSFNGQPRSFIARVEMDGSLDNSFTGGTNGTVWSLALQPNGQIVAAGEFTVANSTPRNRLVRLNSNGSTDPGFLNTQTGADGGISEVALQPDGKMVIVGSFSAFNGGPSGRIARLDVNGAVDATFIGGAGANGNVYTVSLQAGRQMYAGGSFTNFSGLANGSFTRLTSGRSSAFDYDGDGRSDPSVRRTSSNGWYLLRGTAGFTAMTWGVAGDRMAPADYDGDGKTDVAVFRPSNGSWYVFMSQSQTFLTAGWGQAGDLPVPADHNGDGKADLVVYRESNNTWYMNSIVGGPFRVTNFGIAGDKPQVGDFDGDGQADVAVFRPSNRIWYVIKSSLGFTAQTWGEAGDIPAPADYDGDGATDNAVFRPSTGQWFLSRSTAGFSTVNWGQAGDIPVAADYDGDGKSDVALFRPTNSTWYIINSTTGLQSQQFGEAGDIPTQSAFSY